MKCHSLDSALLFFSFLFRALYDRKLSFLSVVKRLIDHRVLLSRATATPRFLAAVHRRKNHPPAKTELAITESVARIPLETVNDQAAMIPLNGQ